MKTIISLFFISIFLPISVYAEHDYFDSYLVWDHAPQVCLQDIPRADRFLTFRAVNSWEKAFDNYVGVGWFDYSIKEVTAADVTGCDIVVMLVKSIISPNTGKPAIGLTSCYSATSLCVARIDRDYQNGEYWYDTVVHEMGHVLGLAHRLAINPAGLPALVLANDIMMDKAKPHLYITRGSLDALIYFYDSGYNGTRFIIPHNATWNQ